MNIRLLSDLHLDFGEFEVDFKMPADVCLLAGDLADIATGSERIIQTVTEIARHHKRTIYVPGNHEFYFGDITNCTSWLHTELKSIVEESGSHLEVFYPQGELEFDGVRFIGATLWTDFASVNGRSDSAIMRDAALSLNDFTHITNWTPTRMLSKHLADTQFIRERIGLADSNPRTVIVTHYPPIPYGDDNLGYPMTPAIRAAYENTNLNPLFDDWQKFKIWCHGHGVVHRKMKPMFSKFVCANTRGYHSAHSPILNPNFDQDFIFAV